MAEDRKKDIRVTENQVVDIRAADYQDDGKQSGLSNTRMRI